MTFLSRINNHRCCHPKHRLWVTHLIIERLLECRSGGVFRVSLEDLTTASHRSLTPLLLAQPTSDVTCPDCQQTYARIYWECVPAIVKKTIIVAMNPIVKPPIINYTLRPSLVVKFVRNKELVAPIRLQHCYRSKNSHLTRSFYVIPF